MNRRASAPKKIAAKALAAKKPQRKSFFEEHYYPVLFAILCAATVILKAGGMSFHDASLTGLLFTAVIFFATQLMSYFKDRASRQGLRKTAATKPPAPTARRIPSGPPQANKKPSQPAKPWDKRYPPPSPFIKPPK